jgi:NADPH-dependent 2,4-dienoyl-CoA reductase/sulfur reductase-like enzyme
VRLELPGKRIITDDGTVFTFEKLLLATGGTPRRLPFGGEDILYFRTLEDYKQLRAWTNEKQRFAVIGGGFIGSEIAAALATNGKAVTLVFPDEGIGARLFPADLSRFLNEYYREHGVEVLPGHTVMDLRQTVSGWQLVLRHELSGDEKTVDVDGVVAGIGLVPNTTLAEESGLPVGDGIVVDELLRAGHPDVYAAGDVANFYNPALAMHVRFEHEDNANAMGRCAGRNMAGDSSPYHHLPFFYSDLFDLGYEAIGLLNPDLETVTEWSEPFRKGVIVYLRDRQVRGVLLWNVWEKLDAARALIAKGEPFQPEDFKALL